MIRFDAPDRPLIAPVSGKYDYQENIIVTVPDGCTVYYAFDETPTIESTQYTDPVPMPQENIPFLLLLWTAEARSVLWPAKYMYITDTEDKSKEYRGRLHKIHHFNQKVD